VTLLWVVAMLVLAPVITLAEIVVGALIVMAVYDRDGPPGDA
jgi:hypothetical protein